MPTAATLAVSVVARIQGLTKGLNRASGEVRRFGRGVASSGSSFGALLGGIGLVVAGATGLGALAKSSIDALDSLSELTTITGLTADQLLAYRHAANLAGVGQEQLETGLLKFAKVVGEAKIGTGALVKTVGKLIPGFGEAIAATETQDQALRLVAQAYAATDDAAIRALIATAAFGRTGALLGEFLAGGAKGLDAAVASLRKFGIVISKEDTANASAAADAIDSLAFVLQNKLLVTVGKLTPFIAEATKKLLDFATSSNLTAPALAATFRAGVLGAAKLVDIFSLLKGIAFGFKGIVESIAEVVLRFVKTLRDSIAPVLNLLPGFNFPPTDTLLDQLIGDFAGAADKSFGAAGEALAAFASGDAARSATAFFDDIERKAKLAAVAAKGTAGALGGLGDIQDRGAATRAAKLQAADVGRALTIDLARTVIGGGAQGPRVQ
ncbi:MAG: hypothetical protein ACREDO_13700, partial [Methyloceanibacter sp.]